jgi:hypothetical protein
MFCHRCGVEVQPRQRFCGDCGAPLAGVPEPGVGAGAGRVDPGFTDELPVTQAVTGVVPSILGTGRSGGARGVYDFAADEPDDITAPAGIPAEHPRWLHAAPAAPPPPPAPAPAPAPAVTIAPAAPVPRTVTTPVITTEQPSVTSPTAATTAEMPVYAPPADRFRFRFGVVTGTSIVAAILTLVGAYANTISIATDASAPTFATGDWLVGDLGSNLDIAGVIAAVALLAGGIAAGFGLRWGAGLAGGAGLAVAGWAALAVGLAEQPLQAARIAVDAPTTEAFRITLTRDLGYWLLLASIVVGGAVFVVSLLHAGNDHRSGLNPWIAAVGAVSALIAAGGPLVPEGSATFRNNWSSAGGTFDQPTAYLAGRLAQLALLAFAGVIGFLQVRRWGLGLAIGGMLPVVWLGATTLLDIGESPVGPGFSNPGSDSVDLHAVTVVGLTALVGLAIVAVIAAYDQTIRERPDV